MHIPSFIKIHWYLLKLSSGNESTNGRMDRRTAGHTEDQRDTIIPCKYRVARQKNSKDDVQEVAQSQNIAYQ